MADKKELADMGEKPENDKDRMLEKETDRNMDLISEFAEHLKAEEGIDIPEYAILSFFNA